jgi:hypothetical protein
MNANEEDDIRIIVQLLPLRFLLTSRPEWPIRLGFKRVTDDHPDLVLHEIPKPMVEHDISLYFEDKFSQLRQEHSLPSG